MSLQDQYRELICGQRGCRCAKPERHTKNGATITVHCPAHSDEHASLDITDAGERHLYICRARCSSGEVFRVMREKGLLPERGNQWKAVAPRPQADTRSGPTERTWKLTLADGRVVEHCRIDKPDGKKTVWWRHKGANELPDGVRVEHLPLYGIEALPEDAALVIVGEGEGVVDALVEADYLAVGTVTGANTIPSDESLKVLVDRTVILWPDNDEPGQTHMQRIEERLRTLGCRDIRWVEWTGAPPKGDAVDALRSGIDVGSLLAAAKQFPASQEPLPDLGELLATVEAFVRRFVVLTPAQFCAVALWVLHTHAIDAADVTPYLNAHSAEKGSGKTRLLETVELFVARPWLTSRTTTAALYRKIDAEHSTLLLDEMDAAMKGTKEYAEALRGVLDAGFQRNGSVTVIVGQGANMQAKELSCFGPKAIAGIGELPGTLADRSISIKMRRRKAGEHVERFRRRSVRSQAAPIRESLASWAARAVPELSEAEPAVPDELDDRAQDAWEPLLAIADMAGGDWPRRARSSAVELAKGRRQGDTDSLGVRLLSDIRALRDKDAGSAYIESSELLSQLRLIEDAPWLEIYGKPLTAHRLGQMLHNYDITSHDQRLAGNKNHKAYNWTDFEDAFSRYLPTQSATSATADNGLPQSKSQSATESIGDFPGTASPSHVALVALSNGGTSATAVDQPISNTGDYRGARV